MKGLDGAARLASLTGTLVAVLVLILAVTGNAPGPALRAGFDESLGDLPAIGDTIALALPLVVIALGTGWAFRTGIFNLGGEGQFLCGALVAAIVGTELSAPSTVVHVGLTLTAGAIAGAVPAAILGALRTRLGVDEVLSTLMSNFLIVLLAQYLVTSPLRDPSRQTGTTRNIDATARFGPVIASSRLTWAIALVLGVVVVTWWVVERTRLGAASRMVGLSPGFGIATGLPVRSLQFGSMAICGAYAGLGGAIVVTASQFRFWSGIGSGLGFIAVLVSLLAGNRPLGAVAWSLVYTMLATSARGMELETSVPSEVTEVALAVVLLLFSSRAALGDLGQRLQTTLRPSARDDAATATAELRP